MTLSEYKNSYRKSSPKIFRGWAIIHSKNGSDWGAFDEWKFIDMYPTKKLAVNAMDEYRRNKSDCLPLQVTKVYC